MHGASDNTKFQAAKVSSIECKTNSVSLSFTCNKHLQPNWIQPKMNDMCNMSIHSK